MVGGKPYRKHGLGSHQGETEAVLGLVKSQSLGNVAEEGAGPRQLTG